MRFALVLLLATVASAAPLDGVKQSMIPHLWPWQQRALAQKIAGVQQMGGDVYALLVKEGVSQEFVRRLAALESGPYAVERFSHRLVLGAEDLSDAQRRLLEVLVPATGAAQVGLWKQREASLRLLKDPERAQVAATFDVTHREIEKRFWRIALYALTPQQRASIRPLYPTQYQMPPDILGHIYQLPDLTPSQHTRIQSLVQEYVSENAADAAEGVRVTRKLQDPKLPAAERARLAARNIEIADRGGRRFKHLVEESLKIYSPEQTLRIHALVPMLSAADRHVHPAEIVKGMRLRPDQQQRLAPLAAKINEAFLKSNTTLQKRLGSMQGEQFGVDAPQAAMANGMHQNAAGERVRIMEEQARTAILTVVEPAQVVAWVISPG